MTTPDILETVGFEKSKIGSGDKELGYVIKRSRLQGLAVGSLAIVAVLSLVAVFTLFEVRFERRSFHRKLRKEEHHAASKLAEVEMELWSQYRDDIVESHEAQALLRSLNSSYASLQAKLQATIDSAAKELNLNKDKATHLADMILHEVAAMQQDNVKHAKHLVDHLVNAGKRGEHLEKHVNKDIVKEMEAEEKHIEEDKKEGGINYDEDHAGGHQLHGDGILAGTGGNDTQEEDHLKDMLDGFWFTFNDYETEFKDKPRQILKEGHPVYTKLKELKKKIDSPEAPSDEEIGAMLDKIDLSSVGAGLGSGRVLPAADIVEELLLIPKIPHKELTALEKDWKAGKKDSVQVFGQLTEWHSQGLVPSGWLAMGVNKEEQEEEKEEEQAEEKEERDGEAKHAAAVS
eukprot:CAMPEP_0204531106 /NCGR_PEP_ID=MMETSP0661-20131031/10989_1 /ASSEMBLY_ACC=CAM_ASM_000606 /TAXON_ID=109239 /ORGANISM="Alexandrium margalefi, Strain AMGDE01CS-322" /LENGTH=402 /DNA_ID=CAMNT_0051537239 /DNA_START=55 /DNA_END=1263 /DNA_ORIENTATION=+